MGWRIVKQPNGLLARFSSVVDDFTDMGLTREEAVRLCREEHGLGAVEAEAKVQRGVDDDAVTAGIEDDDEPLVRWRDALDTVELIHGRRLAAERELTGKVQA